MIFYWKCPRLFIAPFFLIRSQNKSLQRGRGVSLTVNDRPSFPHSMTHGAASNDLGEGRVGNGGEVEAEQSVQQCITDVLCAFISCW